MRLHRLFHPAAALLAFVTPACALAGEFTLMIYESPAALAQRDAAAPGSAAYWARYADYGTSLRTAGILRGGAALVASDVASTGVTAGGAPATLRLGGFFVVDVADRAAALDWARRAPAAGEGGRVDIHAAYPAPTMP